MIGYYQKYLTIKNSFKDDNLFYCFGTFSSVVLVTSLFYAQPLFDLAQTKINNLSTSHQVYFQIKHLMDRTISLLF